MSSNSGLVSRHGNVVPFARRAEDRPIPPAPVFVGVRNAVVGLTAVVAALFFIAWLVSRI